MATGGPSNTVEFPVLNTLTDLDGIAGVSHGTFSFSDFMKTIQATADYKNFNVAQALYVISKSAWLHKELKSGRSVPKIYGFKLTKNPNGNQMNLRRLCAVSTLLVAAYINNETEDSLKANKTSWTMANPLAMRAGIPIPDFDGENLKHHLLLYWGYNAGMEFIAFQLPSLAVALGMYKAKHVEALGLKDEHGAVLTKAEALISLTRQRVEGKALLDYIEANNHLKAQVKLYCGYLKGYAPLKNSAMGRGTAFYEAVSKIIDKDF